MAPWSTRGYLRRHILLTHWVPQATRTSTTTFTTARCPIVASGQARTSNLSYLYGVVIITFAFGFAGKWSEILAFGPLIYGLGSTDRVGIQKPVGSSAPLSFSLELVLSARAVRTVVWPSHLKATTSITSFKSLNFRSFCYHTLSELQSLP